MPNDKTVCQQNELFVSVNGDVCLIDLGVPGAVWKLPISALSWAKKLLPVYAKRLPDLEPLERKQLRSLKKKSRDHRSPNFQAEVNRLQAILDRAQSPVPRYAVYKSIDNKDVPVHRLYLNVGPDEAVAASNGDLCDYTNVHAKVSIAPVWSDNLAVVPGNCDPQSPDRVESDRWVPNLYVKSDMSANPNPSHHEIQDKFEDGQQQPPVVEGKATKVRHNHDLGARTGVFGKIQDCGSHLPGVVDGVDPDDWSRLDVERAVRNLQRAWGISRFAR